MNGPLTGITVLEVSPGIAGSITGMLLADLGAEVWTVPPEDTSFVPADRAAGALRWGRGKRVVADAERSDLSRLLDRLGGRLDVCVDCTPTRDLHRALRHRVPRAVWARVVPSDDISLWSDGLESAELLAAAGGLSEAQSRHDPGPVDFPTPHCLYIQGMWSAACIAAALVAREQRGPHAPGEDVVVDGLDAATLIGVASFALAEGAEDQSPALKGPGGANPFYTRYRCADGKWVFLGALFPRFRERALQALGLEQELMYAVFEEWEWWVVSPETQQVRAALAAAFASRERAHWMSELEALDCPHGPLLHREDWLDHEQVRAIGGRHEFDDPQLGPVAVPGAPVGIRPSEPAVPASARRPTVSTTGSGPGPLAGTKVLDLGTVLAGPLAGSMLSFLGADVLKVEPLEGDGYRVSGFGFNRGMRSIAVDLKSEDGRKALLALVASADIFIENYRPGVLDRLGVGHDVLRSVRPDLVTVALSGFGDSGPLALKQGFDPILQSMSGIMHAQGGDDEPVFLTSAVNDVSSGVGAVLGSIVAVLARIRTGRGSAVSSSLAMMSTFLQSGELVRYAGRPRARIGGRDYQGPAPLDRFYACQGGWVRVQARSDARAALVAAGILPESARAAADTVLTGLLASWCEQRAGDEIVGQFAAVGIPAVVARSPRQLIFAPSGAMGDRFGFCGEVGGGRYHGAQRWARFSESGARGGLFAPGLGEHTREILTEVGYSNDQIDELLASDAVRLGPPLG